jgi:hypothetical protein
VYIKSTLTGDEPADVLNYKKEHPVFPHDSTTNQWFTESQFESYRRLGHHVAFSVFEPAASTMPGGSGRVLQQVTYFCNTRSNRKALFENLQATWWAPTAEMERFSAAHSERFASLLEKARTDPALPGFFDMMMGGGTDWKDGRWDEQVAHATEFSSQLIEFIFIVFNQLELVLPEKRNHPYAQGWNRIFQRWTKIDVVRDGWTKYHFSYSPLFHRFAESPGLPDVEHPREGPG